MNSQAQQFVINAVSSDIRVDPCTLKFSDVKEMIPKCSDATKILAALVSVSEIVEIDKRKIVKISVPWEDKKNGLMIINTFATCIQRLYEFVDDITKEPICSSNEIMCVTNIASDIFGSIRVDTVDGKKCNVWVDGKFKHKKINDETITELLNGQFDFKYHTTLEADRMNVRIKNSSTTRDRYLASLVSDPIKCLAEDYYVYEMFKSYFGFLSRSQEKILSKGQSKPIVQDKNNRKGPQNTRGGYKSRYNKY